MSNIKLSGHTWDTSGIYDAEQEKTQKQVNADVSSLGDAIGHLTNLADSLTWTNGSSIKHSDGTTASSENLRRSDYLDLTGVSEIVYMQIVTTGSSGPTNGIAFYSDTNTSSYISGIQSSFGASTIGDGKLNYAVVPENAKYARFSWWKTSVEQKGFVVYDAADVKAYLPQIVNDLENIIKYKKLTSELATSAVVELGIINDSGLLVTTEPRSSYQLANDSYIAITITASAARSVISFLTDSIHGLINYSPVPLCKNEPPRHIIEAGETATFLVPSDCNYIVIMNIGANGNSTPADGFLYLKDSPVFECIEHVNSEASLPKLSILFVGNSLALDSVSYAPSVLSSLGVKAKLTIGILYLGGQTLENHLENFTTDAQVYNLYISRDLSPWSTVASNCTGLYAVQYMDWDVISFQQASTQAGNYNTFQPYLTDLIEFICNNVAYKWKMAWNNVHSTCAGCDPDDPNYDPYPDPPSSYPAATHATTEANYTKVMAALEELLEENPIEIVFPVATATQNARNTSLASLGRNGELLYDWKHAQEGIACQIEGYTIAIKIMELLGIHNKSIINDDTVIDSDFETYWSIQGQHGDPVGSGTNDTANRRIAQKCAIMACQRPMELSNILTPTLQSP